MNVARLGAKDARNTPRAMMPHPSAVVAWWIEREEKQGENGVHGKGRGYVRPEGMFCHGFIGDVPWELAYAGAEAGVLLSLEMKRTPAKSTSTRNRIARTSF